MLRTHSSTNGLDLCGCLDIFPPVALLYRRVERCCWAMAHIGRLSTMPIYEYRCPVCAHEFETIQKVSDPKPPCPSCGHDDVAKKVSRTSFQLKGTGWYVTDYKPSSSGPSTETSESSASESSASESSSSSESSSGESSSSSGDTSSSSSSGSSSSGDASSGGSSSSSSSDAA